MLMAVMIRPAIASPRTNFEAPSIEPKKELSSSSSRRRVCASLSSITPADRSASIAICLPGMASSVKRAPTSAIRVAPLVITRKFTVIRIRNTIVPITKSPLMTKLAKPSMTWPAASVPSAPLERIKRVVAMFSDRRIIVAISKIVGKDEKSSGRWIHSATIRMRIENEIEIASPKSIRIAGSGRNRTMRIEMMPIANPISRVPAFSTLLPVIAVDGDAISSSAWTGKGNRAPDGARSFMDRQQSFDDQPCAGVHTLRKLQLKCFRTKCSGFPKRSTKIQEARVDPRFEEKRIDFRTPSRCGYRPFPRTNRSHCPRMAPSSPTRIGSPGSWE